jgi:signal transduction histidine kinase
MFIEESKVFFSVIAATLFIVLLMGFFILNHSRQYLRYRLLQEDYNRARLAAAEEERMLLSGDLHDEISTILSATLRKLHEVEANTEVHDQLLKESREHLSTVSQRIREIATALTPRGLAEKGPFYALEEFKSVYLRSHPLELEVQDISFRGLTEAQLLHIYRMLQEIFQNAIKHSRASRLLLTGQRNENTLIIDAEDDGQGFEKPDHHLHKGLGLQNLAYRARAIGGTIEMKSTPDKGTKYRITITINP